MIIHPVIICQVTCGHLSVFTLSVSPPTCDLSQLGQGARHVGAVVMVVSVRDGDRHVSALSSHHLHRTLESAILYLHIT